MHALALIRRSNNNTIKFHNNRVVVISNIPFRDLINTAV